MNFADCKIIQGGSRVDHVYTKKYLDRVKSDLTEISQEKLEQNTVVIEMDRKM